jgi:hypothetical protein
MGLLQPVLDNLQDQYQKELLELAKLESQAKKESNSRVRSLILLMTVQWCVLFYLTYFAFGWDFAEPISILNYF